jgi:hypothetical protein
MPKSTKRQIKYKNKIQKMSQQYNIYQDGYDPNQLQKPIDWSNFSNSGYSNNRQSYQNSNDLDEFYSVPSLNSNTSRSNYSQQDQNSNFAQDYTTQIGNFSEQNNFSNNNNISNSNAQTANFSPNPETFFENERKKIPVATGNSRDAINAFRAKLKGQAFFSNHQESSSVVPVRKPYYSTQDNSNFVSQTPNYSNQNLPSNQNSKALEQQANNLISQANLYKNSYNSGQNNSNFYQNNPTKNLLLRTNTQETDQNHLYTEDFNKQKANYYDNKSVKNSDYYKPKVNSKNYKIAKSPSAVNFFAGYQNFVKIMKFVAIFGVFCLSIVIATTSWSFYNRQTQNKQANAQSSNVDPYISWIKAQNENEFSEKEEDLDKDGLTNFEEFSLKSNPNSANSCNPEKTDMQNLLNLTNPNTCKAIDLKDDSTIEQISKIIDLQKVQENIANDAVEKANSETIEEISPDNLLAIFNVKKYEDLDEIDPEKLEGSPETVQKKKKYLDLIKKTTEYIKKFRSYEAYDRNFESPVHAAVYVQTSFKHNVPLKYVLAIARTESRFGTDRYTRDGVLTRPGANQNIYSLGLDDSGNNKKFESWEKGVEAFGIWYERLNGQGVSDCRKWKIYNPNGDYCSKIENLANQIEDILN